MTSTQSLRFRLGLFATVVTVALTALASLLVGVVRWHGQNAELDTAARLAAFQLAENDLPTIHTVDVGHGGEVFAILLSDEADVLAQEGRVPDSMLAILIDEVWQFTRDNGKAVSVSLADHNAVAAGAFCADGARCDTAVVGVYRESLSEHLRHIWPWLLAAPCVVGLLTLAASRWLIARSLAPVDRMRAELDDITSNDLERRLPVPASNDELATLGRSMNATIERLGIAVSANERFVADAAHELRTPITGARAAFEIGARNAREDLIVDGIGELDRAGRLIDDLLVLARTGAPRPRVDVDIDDLVRAEVDSARLRFPHIRIAGTLAPAQLKVNPDDLRRVVSNLLDNACRYSKQTVAVTVTRTDDSVLVLIDDDGPGIAPEHRAEAFQRFTRIDESRERGSGGSGLGLAIVHELVSDLGGTVTISDSTLGGASLQVKLLESAATSS